MDSRALNETEILERLTNVKSALEKEEFERAVTTLTAMRSWTTQLTTALLLSTQLGKTMNGWRKHAHAGVATIAGELVSQWKDLVRESAGKTVGPSPAAKAVIEERKASVAAGAAAAAVSAASKPTTAAIGGAGALAAGGAGSSGTGSAAGLAADLAAPLPALAPAPLVDLYAASATASGYAAGPPVCHRDRIRVLRKGASNGSSGSSKKGSAAAAGGAGAADSSGSAAGGGPVIYWMSRDQRVLDNWALLRAQELALARGVPLVVAFCLLPSYADATLRAYGFMLRGLRIIEADLAALNIPFRLLLGEPRAQIAGYANALHASAVVADFCPLRVPMQWKKDVAAALHTGCAFEEVDAHNIVPCWEASPKLEVGARTIRKKIHTAIGTYCKEIPAPIAHPHALPAAAEEGLRTYDGSSSGGSSNSSSGGAGAGAGAGVSDASDPGAADVCLAPRQAAAASSSSAGSSGASGADSSASVLAPTAWATVLSHLRMDTVVGEVAWAKPGERAAAEVLTVSHSSHRSS